MIEIVNFMRELSHLHFWLLLGVLMIGGIKARFAFWAVLIIGVIAILMA